MKTLDKKIKKIIPLFLLFFSLSFFIFPSLLRAEGTESTGITNVLDNQIARQLLKNLKDEILKLKPYSKKDFKRLQRSREVIKGIVKGEIDCHIFAILSSVGELDSNIASVSSNVCSDTSTSNKILNLSPTLISDPRFEHCTSPSDLECVCMHHPDLEQCAGISGMGMDDTEKPCIPKEVADSFVQNASNISTSLKELFTHDVDGNGSSDLCEGNL